MFLKGTVNERDLGGIAAADNRRVRKGLFLRTDSLHALTDDDVKVLREEYNVSIIIDLRNEEESAQKPDRVIEGTNYYQIPLFLMPQAGITHEEDTVIMIDGVPDMNDLYKKMVSVEMVSSRLGDALRLIIHNVEGNRQRCSLFHCVAGKDRTGVLAMLILGILGVREEDIMKDYLMTNVTGIDIANSTAAQVEKETGNTELAERVRKAYTADESFLRGALDYIYDNYSTICNYCRDQLNITEEEMDAFRERTLE